MLRRIKSSPHRLKSSPYKYLYRHLDGLSLKAVLVRPGLIDWNPISRTHTLEQMLEEIGEPVYRWKRKEVVE